jgi:hypothetical protein
MWNIFGFGHRKGPHDGTRVVFKWFIRKCQLYVIGHELQNAEWVVKLLCERLNDHLETSYGEQQRLINRTFWHIKTTYADKEN